MDCRRALTSVNRAAESSSQAAKRRIAILFAYHRYRGCAIIGIVCHRPGRSCCAVCRRVGVFSALRVSGTVMAIPLPRTLRMVKVQVEAWGSARVPSSPGTAFADEGLIGSGCTSSEQLGRLDPGLVDLRRYGIFGRHRQVQPHWKPDDLRLVGSGGGLLQERD